MVSGTLHELAAHGCLPVSVSLAKRRVVFTPLVDADFREPKFGETVQARGSTELYVCPIEAFTAQATRLDVQDQPRLIAHTARCGSTLLANLLALRDRTLVLKEPGFLITAAQLFVTASSPGERAAAAGLVRGLVRYSCAVASAHARDLVIKLTSWTSPVVHHAMSGAHSGRWLLLWRDPAEVVASLLANPPRWWTREDTRADLLTLLGCGASASMGQAEFHARTWRLIVAAFLTAAEEGPAAPVRVLDYDTLTRGKLRALLAVESWLGLRGDGTAPPGFAAEQDRYSKASGSEPFDPSGAHRRAPLAPEDLDTVERVTRDTVRALREGPARVELLADTDLTPTG